MLKLFSDFAGNIHPQSEMKPIVDWATIQETMTIVSFSPIVQLCRKEFDFFPLHISLRVKDIFIWMLQPFNLEFHSLLHVCLCDVCLNENCINCIFFMIKMCISIFFVVSVVTVTFFWIKIVSNLLMFRVFPRAVAKTWKVFLHLKFHYECCKLTIDRNSLLESCLLFQQLVAA